MAKEKLSGQLAAMGRQGAKDLADRIVPAFPTNGPGVDEAGTPLNPTSQMVTKGLTDDYHEQLSVYAAKGRPAERAPEMER
jgi:hypothetical protein